MNYLQLATFLCACTYFMYGSQENNESFKSWSSDDSDYCFIPFPAALSYIDLTGLTSTSCNNENIILPSDLNRSQLSSNNATECNHDVQTNLLKSASNATIHSKTSKLSMLSHSSSNSSLDSTEQTETDLHINTQGLTKSNILRKIETQQQTLQSHKRNRLFPALEKRIRDYWNEPKTQKPINRFAMFSTIFKKK